MELGLLWLPYIVYGVICTCSSVPIQKLIIHSYTVKSIFFVNVQNFYIMPHCGRYCINSCTFTEIKLTVYANGRITVCTISLEILNAHIERKLFKQGFRKLSHNNYTCIIFPAPNLPYKCVNDGYYIQFTCVIVYC